MRSRSKRRRDEIARARRSPGLLGWIIAVSVPVAFAWTVADKNLGWVDGIKHAVSGRTHVSVSAETSRPAPTLSQSAASMQPPDGTADPQNGFAAGSTSRYYEPRDDGGTHVYRCLDANGQSIFSDQPCAGIVEVRRYDSAKVNTYSAPRSAGAAPTTQGVPSYSSSQTVTRSTSYSSSSARQAPGRPAICDSIQQQLDAINARMRQRYTSQQGEWFRGQIRSLKRMRDESRCTR